MKRMGWIASVASTFALVFIAGCASSYSTPGARADFQALGITPEESLLLTDGDIQHAMDRKPLAHFPANIAVVRVQGSGYRSYTNDGYGSGRITVVTTRDVETDEQFARLHKLPMVSGIAPVGRLLLPERIDAERDLRAAAARLQADMVLLYTFDTRFDVDTPVEPLGLITLGLFPDRSARVNSTASAVLIDTRNGYVYGTAEGSAKDSRLANAWTSEDAADASRRAAETEAFDALVGQIETMWNGVVSSYGPASAAGAVDEVTNSPRRW